MEWIIVFVIICVIGVVFEWLFPTPPEPPKQKEMTQEERREMLQKHCDKFNTSWESWREARRLYYDSLKSRDKSESVDLGIKFYEKPTYPNTITIVTLERRQLTLTQIQTDILAHS